MIRRIAFTIAATAFMAAAAQIPRPAGDVTINLNGGKRVQLSSYKGKAVVLVFILTTCSHCQATTGVLSKLQAEYGPRGLQVIESAVDQGAEAFVPRFIQSYNPPFPVGFNDFTVALDYTQHSPVKTPSVPMLVFIDRQWNIVAELEGSDPEMAQAVQEQNLRAQIEKLLKPTVARAPAKKKK